MKLIVKKDTTSKMIQFFIPDSSSAVGAGLTGLVFNTASLTAYYYREGAATSTVISLATMTLGTWSTSGFVVVDGTNMPGLYQLGIPNAALATGANSVVIMLKGATNMAPTMIEIQLVDYDPNDGVRLGLTALPNAAAGANGGLPTGDASGRVTVGSMAASVVTASAIASDAITAAKIATDAIDADALATDAVTEIWAKAMSDITAVPAMTASVFSALNWVFALARNRRTQTATTETVYKDDGATTLATSAKSDDGTTFTRAEYS